jgi:GTP-binding protein HflX
MSAKTGAGIENLLTKIDERLGSRVRRVTIHLPYDKGGLLDILYREAKVEQVEYADTIDVVAVCTPKTIGRLGPLVEGWTEPKEEWEL